METNKLFTLLKTLSNYEFRQFLSFFESFYPRKKKQVALLHLLKKNHPQYQSNRNFNRETIYFILTGEKQIDNKKLGNGLAEIHKALKEFLIWQQVKKTPSLKTQALLGVYRARNLGQEYHRVLQQRKQELADLPLKNQWHLLEHFQLLHYSYFSAFENKLKHKGEQAEVLHDVVHELQRFYLAAAAKYQAEYWNRKRILQDGLDWDFPISATQDPAPSELSTLTDLYRIFAQDISDEEEHIKAIFLTGKQFLERKIVEIHQEDLGIIWSYLSNVGAMWNRQATEAQALQEIFRLTKLVEGRALFQHQNLLTPTNFLNIVELGIFMEEPEWVRNFVNRNIAHLPPDVQASVKNLSLAFVHFHLAQYESSLTLLNEVDLHDHSMKIRLRYLSIQNLYHLGEFQVLTSQLQAFKNFLHRDQVFGEEIDRAYFNFIKVVRWLLNPNLSKAVLTEKVAKLERLACKTWLKKQIEQRV